MSCIRLKSVDRQPARLALYLPDHDLRQLDRDALSRLEEKAVRRLAARLLADLKEARDRLNQNSRNSSRPPGSDSVYRQPRGGTECGDSPTDSAPDEAPVVAVGEAEGKAEASGDGTPGPNEPSGAAVPAERRPGRQSGAPGFGRTQKLAVNAVLDHWPERCAACDGPFAAEPESQADGGYDEIEVLPADANAPGLRLWVTQHRFWEVPCGCAHCSRYQPPRAVVLPEWEGARSDAQQMLGPRLAGLIVMLCLRYRLSRAKVQELLWELLGLRLSTGLIDQTIRQSAGQVAPVEDLLLEEIRRARLLHLDETLWREGGLLLWLWLWVFNALTTVVYFVAARSAEIFVNALQGGFRGCLMSDAYAVYRSYLNRIRCLAHLLRKARGLAEATCRHTSQIGQELLGLLGALMQATQAARDGPFEDLAERQAPVLAQRKALCERHQHSPFVKLGKFCREMLNDWEAIIRPLLDPGLPLTNNAAERLLRHWVIAHRLSFGTHSEQGTRSFALLASIIDTCRARKASAWDYLTAALQSGRQGLPMPPLSAVAVGG